MGADVFEISINLIKLVVIFLLIVQAVPILVWVERRGSAFIQDRLGPNRVGPMGLLQLGADAIKFLFKEEFSPKSAIKFIFYAAPVVALVPAALGMAAIPLSVPIEVESFEWLGSSWGPYQFALQGYDIGVGIVFVMAVSSLAAYAVLMAGWGSGSKYSLLGALRASAQMVSYELALSLAVVGVVLLYGTFDFTEMIAQQLGPLSFKAFGNTITASWLPNWGIFYQPLAAILFLSAAFAESNRLPFDLAEGESELVAGFHTEYGGFKMLLFFIGEYGHMIVSSALMVVFFFGGFALPIPGWTPEAVFQHMQTHFSSTTTASIMTSLVFFVSFSLKLIFFLWFYIWVRWTLPRFRYDQLMDLGWKNMLPWALFNTLLTAIVIYIIN